jgi:hypothetical protein
MIRLFICKNLDTKQYEFRAYLGNKDGAHTWSSPRKMVDNDWLEITKLPKPDPVAHISALQEIHKDLWLKVSNIFGVGPKLTTTAKEVASYLGYGNAVNPVPKPVPKVRFLNRQETV